MTSSEKKAAARVLSPTERFGEVIFGLIMVLSFTCSLSVGTAGRQDVQEMLIGAIGCNVAWGIVDAVMYILNVLAERGHGHLLLQDIRRATDPAAARATIVEALPEPVVAVMQDDDIESLRKELCRLPVGPSLPHLRADDWRGAIGVFLLVFLSTFPVVLPFAVVGDATLALRVSNAIAILMLFGAGYGLARYSGLRPARTGLAMVAIGAVLVAITIALGG